MLVGGVKLGEQNYINRKGRNYIVLSIFQLNVHNIQ